MRFSAHHRPTVLNQPALRLLNSFGDGTRAAVIEQCRAAWGEETLAAALDRMVRLELLAVPERLRDAPADSPTTLSAWLHVTDRCNLRCAYCYLPHLRSDMSLDVGRAAVDATMRAAIANGHRVVRLKYAGGEPLLRFDFVEELHRYARSAAEAGRLELHATVLSNGTLLTDARAAALTRLGLRLMISLDGLGRAHDGQRPYAGGRGSFADVARGIDVARAHGVTPDISITVTGASAAGLPDLVAWVLARDLPFSLNFYRENELSATHHTLRLEEQQIIDGMRRAFDVIAAALPRRSLLSALVDRANLAAPHRYTCAAGHDYLVFDERGRVAACQMHLRRPVAGADTQAADPLALVRADPSFRNLPVEAKEGCRTCEWRHWCTGGCPISTFRATGRFDVQSPNCGIYTALYPEAVRLEGLRLLRYGAA